MPRWMYDVLIGWNQGAAEKHELAAKRARQNEARWRAEYRRRWPSPWRRA